MQSDHTGSAAARGDHDAGRRDEPTAAGRDRATSANRTVKQYRLRLRPESGAISSLDAAIDERDGVEPRAFLSLDRCRDGTVVAVYELCGDPAALEPLLADADGIDQWATFNEAGETFNCYLRVEPEPLGDALLSVLEEYGLVLDTPVPITADGGLLVTVAGPESAISAAVADVPDEITLELTTLRDYEPTDSNLKGVLTDRQREVLEVAIERGYYSLPREATQDDLAAAFDCTPTTIGNHLRKAEARVLSEVFGKSP